MSSSFDFTIQKPQISDIFQVSINSKKLISILKHLQDNHKKLQKKIDRIQDFYQEGDSLLNKKILNLQTSIKDLIKDDIQQIRKEIQADIRKQQEKYINELLQKQNKIKQLKYSVQTLNQKINKTNTLLTEENQKTIKNFAGSLHLLKRNFQNSQQLIQGAIQELAQKIQTDHNQLQNNKQNIFDIQIKIKKLIQNLSRPQDANYIHDPHKKIQDCVNVEKYNNLIQQNMIQKSKMTNSPVKQIQRKKTNKKSLLASSGMMKKKRMFTTMDSQQKQPNQNYMSTLQYASISAKVETLQQKIKQNAQKLNDTKNTSNNQSVFKRGQKTNMMKTFSYSKQNFQQLITQKNKISQINFQQMDDVQILANIMMKLQMIQKSMQQRQKSLKQMIQRIRQKQITNSQKIDFLKQKNNKVYHQLSQFKIKLVKLQKKTSQQEDLRAITNIQNQIGKIIQRLDKEYQVKMDLQMFIQQKKVFLDKFSFIQENLVYKAQKEDVKKAINFLQDKIKQIILVLANQFNEQKLGSITKAPKCLTCDREVLKLENLTGSTSQGALKGLNIANTERQTGQKYYTRLLKSKKQNKQGKKKVGNYTLQTVMTQKNQKVSVFH